MAFHVTLYFSSKSKWHTE